MKMEIGILGILLIVSLMTGCVSTPETQSSVLSSASMNTSSNISQVKECQGSAPTLKDCIDKNVIPCSTDFDCYSKTMVHCGELITCSSIQELEAYGPVCDGKEVVVNGTIVRIELRELDDERNYDIFNLEDNGWYNNFVSMTVYVPYYNVGIKEGDIAWVRGKYYQMNTLDNTTYYSPHIDALAITGTTEWEPPDNQ